VADPEDHARQRSHQGLERLTPGTTYIFVANHQSHYDTPVIFSSLPYQLRIIAQGVAGALSGARVHLKRGGHLFVDRGNPDPSGILARWRALVSEGLSLIIYAEGTRSRDGRVARFKAGSFLLAIQAGLPIVPLAVVGTRGVMPKGRLQTEPGDVQLIVHDPIPVPALDRPTVRDARALAARAHAWSRRPSSGCRIRQRRYNSHVHVTAIVAAGGRGERFGASQPKQLFVIGGRSILERSVQLLVSHPEVAEVVVALPLSLAARSAGLAAGMRQRG
jgi:1-acyl-sn-glycerol-3-phosphate acyltransferase